ncbi:MAG: tetratricopeptide repeat protein [Rhodospirillales bacterium]|nr:tetratricopeptide repeat protein [Rhodospirillales bacterium]
MAETAIDLTATVRQAIEHHRAGRLREAEQVCRQVLRQDPAQPQALTLLGVIARQAGRTDTAIELFRRATVAAPSYADAYYNLGNALRDRNDRVGAVAAYDRALALRPDQAGWHNNRAVVLLAEGDAAGAEAGFRRAVELEPRYAEAHSNLGNALLKQGRLDEAVTAYRQALAINPDFPGALANLGGALIQAGRIAEALAPLDRLLARDPQQVRAVAYKAIALRELGRHAEADVLEDVELLVGRDRPPPPLGYADMADFNAQLVADIRSHPTLTKDWDPYQRAARHGSVAVDLLAHKTPTIAAFEAMIRRAIDGFAASLPDRPGHPFLHRKPRRYDLIVWANILAESGHQAAHIHNLGWLSGVYYPFIPEVVRDGDPDCLGWIEFGRPGYDLPCRYEPRVTAIKPENGLILMFPSYFWHRTIPFQGAPERISIAFDVHMRE